MGPRGWVAVWVGVVLLAGCQASAVPGASCARAAECGSPLVCRFGRCRAECSEARDCPVGARCIGSAGAGVCTLDVENHCTASICPSPLSCVADQCRTLCTTTADCLAGACEGTSCVEPISGMDAGPGLDSAMPDSGQDDGGAIDGGQQGDGGDGGPSDGGASDGGSSDASISDADLDGGTCSGAACARHIVISEIATGRAFYVELYAPGPTAVDLTGCTISLIDATGLPQTEILTSAVVPAHGYFLLGSTMLADVDQSASGAYTVRGVDGVVRLACAGTTIDEVGWGMAASAEGTPLANWHGASAERKANPSSTTASMQSGGADELAGNASDTNDNAADFIIRDVPDPQWSASAHEG